MDTLNNALSVLRTNPYVSASTSLFLVLYAGLAAPALPASVAGLFENSVFKILILVAVLVLLKGQNITTALLVAIGFVISMNTLSQYRVSAMASELSALNPPKSDAGTAPVPAPTTDPALGPDGIAPTGPFDVAEWSLKDGNNRLRLHGYDYEGQDAANHLPGGHGDMELNEKQQVSDATPSGYDGPGYATIGGTDSQL
jgi:hypothetical protein